MHLGPIRVPSSLPGLRGHHLEKPHRTKQVIPAWSRRWAKGGSKEKCLMTLLLSPQSATVVLCPQCLGLLHVGSLSLFLLSPQSHTRGYDGWRGYNHLCRRFRWTVLFYSTPL